MNTVTTITATLLLLLASSCEQPARNQQHTRNASRIDVSWVDENGYSNEEQFTIIVIDGCEYLVSNYDRSRAYTHKGNCRNHQPVDSLQ